MMSQNKIKKTDSLNKTSVRLLKLKEGDGLTESNALMSIQIKSKKAIFLWLLALAFISTIAYLPTFNNGLTNWDDDKYVTNNPYFDNLSLESIKKNFTSYYDGNYIPLSMVSLAIDYSIGGRDNKNQVKAFPFHFDNLLLHVIVSILTFFFIYSLLGRFDVAILVAALFSVHSLHVESVAWISERKDVLYATFFMASLICYVNYLKENKITAYIGALLFFIFSLLSKGQAVSLAVSLLAIDYLKRRDLLSVKLIIEKIPFFTLSILFGIVAIMAQKSSSAIRDTGGFEFYKRIGFAGYAFIQYLLRLLLPIELSAIYPYPDIINGTIPMYYWLYLIPIFLLLYILYKAIKKDDRIVVFSISFFIINIFLLLQFIPVGSAVWADRYAYIPSIGYFILLGYFYRKIVTHFPELEKGLILFFVMYILLLSVLTFNRTLVWKNSKTLWDDVLQKQPKAVFAWNNRGDTKYKDGLYAEAIGDFSKAIELKPDYVQAFHNRGMAKKELGLNAKNAELFKDAILDFNKVIEIRSESPQAFHNRGIVKYYLGDLQGACLDFSKAFELNPKDINPLIKKGLINGKVGKLKEALANFNTVLRIEPSNAEAYSNRALTNEMLGNLELAILDYDRAIKIDRNLYTAYALRGILKKKMRNFNGALKDLTISLKLSPNSKEVLYNRGLVWRELKNLDNSTVDFSRLIKLSPKIKEAYYYRGMNKLESGNKNDACVDFSIAAQMKHEEAIKEVKRNCR